MEKEIIGDYEIIKQLGVGPLGSVLLANHRFLKKVFVLKVLPRELSSNSDFIKRFEDLVSFVAKIEHPNIVKIHTVHESDGRFFLVEDPILDNENKSHNLFEVMKAKQGRFSEKEIIEMLFQIAGAIDAMHSHGIAHLALKPNNILIKDGNYYLSDGGITPIVSEQYIVSKSYKVASENLSLTSPDATNEAFLQTFSYLSPEQQMSQPPQNIMESDAYAFGVLVYYLITQRFPMGRFPMPSSIALDFRSNWDDLIDQCLQYDPSKRPTKLTEILSHITHETRNHRAPIQTPTKKIPLEDVAKIAITTPKVPENKSTFDPITDHLQPKAKPSAQIFSHRQPAVVQETATAVAPVETKLKPRLSPQELQKPTFEADPGAIFQTDTIVAPYIPEKKQDAQVEPILTDMIVIPGGEFYRGSNEGARDERPHHNVILSSYAVDIHPVTNEQFIRFLEAMDGEKDAHNHDILRLKESRISKHLGKYLIESGYARHPVIGVTWYGAVAYAKWVGKRLPTEAEWEVASRALNTDVIYPTGNEIDRDHANYFSADTSAVMSFPANEIGLYDMSGNVYEWCTDWYDYSFYETSVHEPHNPVGPHQGFYRVLRGGCWKSLKDDLRCSHRHRNNPGTVNRTYGFRCASNVS